MAREIKGSEAKRFTVARCSLVGKLERERPVRKGSSDPSWQPARHREYHAGGGPVPSAEHPLLLVPALPQFHYSRREWLKGCGKSFILRCFSPNGFDRTTSPKPRYDRVFTSPARSQAEQNGYSLHPMQYKAALQLSPGSAPSPRRWIVPLPLELWLSVLAYFKNEDWAVPGTDDVSLAIPRPLALSVFPMIAAGLLASPGRH